jgi:hypothetical protein
VLSHSNEDVGRVVAALTTAQEDGVKSEVLPMTNSFLPRGFQSSLSFVIGIECLTDFFLGMTH